MQTSHLAYADTERFGKIILDYLHREESLKPFYGRPPEIESFRKQIEDKNSAFKHRKELVSTIRKQNEGYKGTDSLIDRLADEKAFTVTTGHQLCLFTGPLYFVYKIISTIKLAEQLRRQYNSNDFVPVFWMASEDHDFDEANHAYLFNKKISWESGQGGAVGRMNLAGISEVLAEMREIMGDSEHARNALKMIENAYHSREVSVAQAMRKLIYTIFGEGSVLVIDGDDQSLKSLFVPQMKRELTEQFSNQAIEETNAALGDLYSLQVTQREINLFYLGDQMRERIILDGDRYKVLHTDISFSRDEILQELEDHPERFSPNVVLRPLYQEVILPNLAYIGGGGELSYWFQLKKMFDSASVPFPIVMLRNSVMWVSKNESKKMDRLELTVEHLFGDREKLIKEMVRERSDQELSLDGERDELSALFERIADRAAEIDPTLKKMVLADEARAAKSLDGIEKRLVKAEKQQHSQAVNQINNIFDKLYPDGKLQERHQNYFEFYLRYGDEFLKTLMKNLDPFSQKFTVITEPFE